MQVAHTLKTVDASHATPTRDRRRAAAAARTALWRERRRLGLRIIPVPVCDEVVDVLIEDGRLPAEEQDDLGAVGKAIALLLLDTLYGSEEGDDAAPLI